MTKIVTATAVMMLADRGGLDLDAPGRSPPACPPLSESQPARLGQLALPAFSVFIVAFSDDVLTARAFARRGEQISANRELLALGTGNAAVSLVHGFPVSSSATRTAMGTAAGGRTQLTSLIAAGAVLVVLYAARPLLAAFPLGALAALVVYAAIRLIDLPALRRLLTFRRGELIIAVSACLGVLALGILDGVLVAIGVSVAELLLRVARPHDAILGLVPGLAGMHDVDDYPCARTIPGLVVYRYDAPLFFANAQDFRRRALAAARRDGAARWFVLNVEANVEVDFTALEALTRSVTNSPRMAHLRARPRQTGSAGPPQHVRAHREIGPGCSSRPCRPRSPPTGTGPPGSHHRQARTRTVPVPGRRPRARCPERRAEHPLRRHARPAVVASPSTIGSP